MAEVIRCVLTQKIMLPLYNKNAELSAWLGYDGNLFSLEMEWLAFIADGHVFASGRAAWLGPIKGATLMDRQGKPILWSPGYEVEGQMPPMQPLEPQTPDPPLTPMQPIEPETPCVPITPSTGWSTMPMRFWLAQY